MLGGAGDTKLGRSNGENASRISDAVSLTDRLGEEMLSSFPDPSLPWDGDETGSVGSRSYGGR